MSVTYSVSNYESYNQTGDKNLFEVVVDDVILDRHSDDLELRDYIKSLPRNNKRLGVLSLLSKDNVLWSKIADIQNSNQSKYKKIKAITMALRDYVKIADVERKQHGEILTPFDELAKPMVNLVDKYDLEFWKNPNHKVLDSSAGYGTFLILCLYKFMEGLKDVIIDEDERLKHIIENQLYYGELQSKSVFSWLVSVDIEDEYVTNTYWGSFLDEGFDYHMKNVWGVEKFDLIIQNPPYQMRKEGFKKTQPLWHLFVQKSLTLLEEGGYMVMVHPSGWRNVDGVFKETQLKLRENQILELNINNEKEGIRLFNADTRFDYYILKKETPHKHTNVICQDKKMNIINDIKIMEFIPNGEFDYIKGLIANEEQEKVSVLYSRSAYGTDKENVNKESSEKFKYPVVYTVPKGDTLNLVYSSCNDKGHFGQSKLIWSNGRIVSVGSVIDYNGDYGLTQFSYAIVDNIENLDNIKKAFDSSKFRKIMELSAVGDMSINRKVIATFRRDFWKEFI